MYLPANVFNFSRDHLTRYQTTDFKLFQSERVCIVNCNENGRKLSKWVENTDGKGEIARYEQFLFHQCFRKTNTADT